MTCYVLTSLFLTKTKLIWYAIAGGNRILQVQIPMSDSLGDFRKAIAKEMQIKSRQVINIWKVSNSYLSITTLLSNT